MENDSLPPPPPIPQQLLSPTDLPADPDGSLRWWKPTWADVARRLGWRWLYLIPLMLVLLLFVWGLFSHLWFLKVFWYGGNLWLWLGAGAVGAVVEAMRLATKARNEPFCIHCGYMLQGLPDQHICPECGRPYSFELIKLYQNDPKWFVQRWQMRNANPIGVPFHAGASIAPRQNDGT